MRSWVNASVERGGRTASHMTVPSLPSLSAIRRKDTANANVGRTANKGRVSE